MEKKAPRRPLSVKLIVLPIAIILALSSVLLITANRVNTECVTSLYYSFSKKTLENVADEYNANAVEYLWKMIDTDEFRKIQQKAIEADDESIIKDWMLSKPNQYGQSGDDSTTYFHEEVIPASLYQTYCELMASLEIAKEMYDLESVYIQRDVGDNTYIIIDTSEGLLSFGLIDDPNKFFADSQNNEAPLPAVYTTDKGWFCCIYEPLIAGPDSPNAGQAIALAGVNFRMSEIAAERIKFLRQTFLYILFLTIAAIAATSLLMRRLVTRPLRKLTAEAMRFTEGSDSYSKESMIRMDYGSNDEILDLYQDIQEMQTRILADMDDLQTMTAEKERASTELHMAASIQQGALPALTSDITDRPEFTLSADMIPAREVGGDFYDFFFYDEDHLVLVIADVSNKGVPASLFMMASKIMIGTYARQGTSPAEILTSVNQELYRINKSRMFVTVWLGILDIPSGVLTCSNAGHQRPIVRGSDGVFRILKDKHGLVVAVRARSKYSDYQIQLAPGDAIFVYTDGVTEANNADGEFYGEDRLEAVLNRTAGSAGSSTSPSPEDILDHTVGSAGSSPEEIMNRTAGPAGSSTSSSPEDILNRSASPSPEDILRTVREDVDAFVGDMEPFDDLTMLCLVYNGK